MWETTDVHTDTSQLITHCLCLKYTVYELQRWIIPSHLQAERIQQKHSETTERLTNCVSYALFWVPTTSAVFCVVTPSSFVGRCHHLPPSSVRKRASAAPTEGANCAKAITQKLVILIQWVYCNCLGAGMKASFHTSTLKMGDGYLHTPAEDTPVHTSICQKW